MEVAQLVLVVERLNASAVANLCSVGGCCVGHEIAVSVVDTELRHCEEGESGTVVCRDTVVAVAGELVHCVCRDNSEAELCHSLFEFVDIRPVHVVLYNLFTGETVRCCQRDGPLACFLRKAGKGKERQEKSRQKISFHSLLL